MEAVDLLSDLQISINIGQHTEAVPLFYLNEEPKDDNQTQGFTLFPGLGQGGDREPMQDISGNLDQF